jgi:hypothetical protein
VLTEFIKLSMIVIYNLVGRTTVYKPKLKHILHAWVSKNPFNIVEETNLAIVYLIASMHYFQAYFSYTQLRNKLTAQPN